MSSPESKPEWGWEEVDETIADDWSIASLVEQEAVERREVFTALRSQLQRVESFGRSATSVNSYHETYIEDGARLAVYFDRTSNESAGEYYRAWVNIVGSTPDGGRILRAYDFAVSATDDLLVVNEDVRYRGHYEHKWPDLTELYAPFLNVRNGVLTRIASPNYAYAEPTHDEWEQGDILEMFDQRHYAQQLHDVLKYLDATSCDTDITW